ncbi:hypothetical protein MF672_019215 [Actinomadura sp. ATCC 31491]|uniref:Bacterial spore germination immunoglobulin-like domain-containing protein n=1 Tax=Actinomadura luzonensis TaxID=2805427 RepID=A0ABT0FUG8_9ACTN|nr:hypothetical protein [Actinomadura luzonensis]MCK2215909.1 hypothetical protein [Actinomadura luzonensis]
MTARTGRAMVLLIALGVAAAGCGGEPRPESPSATPSAAGPPPSPSSSPSPASPSSPASSPSPASPPESSGSPPGTPEPAPRGRDLVAGRYQPLWPFRTQAEAAGWSRANRADGRDAWHLDPARTAVRFARDHLGFTEIDRAVKTVRDGVHARVHVGMATEEGSRPLVAAVVHLVRYGPGADAPWEVVGTDDSTFSLTTPRYGASVGSPMTVAGRITGVDESIRVQVRRPGGGKALGEHCCVGAGGEKTPWSAKVTFTPVPGTVLTVVASTGGHVASVERFAVTAVTVAP